MAQRISHFDEHLPLSADELAKLPAAPSLGQNVFSDISLAPEGAPINVLLLDTLNTPLDKQAAARQQLRAYVKMMSPGTQLAVFKLGQRLTMLQALTSDVRLLTAALERPDAAEASETLPASMGDMSASDYLIRLPTGHMKTLEAQQTTEDNRTRAVETLAALRELAHYFGGLPGRKNLVWFSGSFPQDPRSNTGGFQQELHETLNLLASSRVAVYPVDARGLTNAPMSDASSNKYVNNAGAALPDASHFGTLTRDEQSTMRVVADATGGKVYVNGNDFAHAIGEAFADESYYTLSYVPQGTAAAKDDAYHRISIALVNGKGTLRYRSGYYSDKTEAAVAADKRDAMRAAMQHGAAAPSEILFKAVVVGSAKTSDKLADGNLAVRKAKGPYRVVTIAYAASAGDLTMVPRPDGTTQVGVEFVALVYDHDGQLLIQQANPVNVYAKPETLQQIAREGVRFQQQVAVPAKGEFSLRIGVHDTIGDKVGVIEVPSSAITTTP